MEMNIVQLHGRAVETDLLEQSMSPLASRAYRLIEVLLIAALLCIAVPGQAQEKVVVAVVLDGPSDRLAAQQQRYVDELLVLTANEFDVEIRTYVGAWSKDSTLSSIDAAYADPDVNLVLVTGFVGNQLAATRSEFPKPTFLPVILDTGLLKCLKVRCVALKNEAARYHA